MKQRTQAPPPPQHQNQGLRASKTMPKLNYTQADIQEQYYLGFQDPHLEPVRRKDELQHQQNQNDVGGAKKRAKSSDPSGTSSHAHRLGQFSGESENQLPGGKIEEFEELTTGGEHKRPRGRRSQSASRLLSACFNGIPTFANSIVHLNSTTSGSGTSTTKKTTSILSHFRRRRHNHDDDHEQETAEELRNRRPLSNSQTVGNLALASTGSSQQTAQDQDQEQDQDQDQDQDEDQLAISMNNNNQRKHVSFGAQRRALVGQEESQNALGDPHQQPQQSRQRSDTVIMKNYQSAAPPPQPAVPQSTDTIMQSSSSAAGGAHQRLAAVHSQQQQQQQANIQSPPSTSSIYLTRQQQQPVGQPICQQPTAHNNSSPSGYIISAAAAGRHQPPQQVPIYKRLPQIPMRTQATQTDITAYHLMASSTTPSAISSSAVSLVGVVAVRPASQPRESPASYHQSIQANTSATAVAPVISALKVVNVDVESHQRDDNDNDDDEANALMNVSLLASLSNSSSSVSLVGHDSALADTLDCDLRIKGGDNDDNCLANSVPNHRLDQCNDDNRDKPTTANLAPTAPTSIISEAIENIIEPPGAFKDNGGSDNQQATAAVECNPNNGTVASQQRSADAGLAWADKLGANDNDLQQLLRVGNEKEKAEVQEEESPEEPEEEEEEEEEAPSLSEASSQTDASMASSHVLERIGRALELAEQRAAAAAAAKTTIKSTTTTSKGRKCSLSSELKPRPAAAEVHQQPLVDHKQQQQPKRRSSEATASTTTQLRCVVDDDDDSKMLPGSMSITNQQTAAHQEEQKASDNDYATKGPYERNIAEATAAKQRRDDFLASSSPIASESHGSHETADQQTICVGGPAAASRMEILRAHHSGDTELTARLTNVTRSARAFTSTLSTRHHSYCSTTGGAHEQPQNSEAAPSDFYDLESPAESPASVCSTRAVHKLNDNDEHDDQNDDQDGQRIKSTANSGTHDDNGAELRKIHHQQDDDVCGIQIDGKHNAATEQALVCMLQEDIRAQEEEKEEVGQNCDGDGEPKITTTSSPSPPTTVSELDGDEELSTPSFVDNYKRRLESQVGELADVVSNQLIGECLDQVALKTTTTTTTTTKTTSSSTSSLSSSTRADGQTLTKTVTPTTTSSRTSSTTSADGDISYVCTSEGEVRRAQVPIGQLPAAARPQVPIKPAHLRVSTGTGNEANQDERAAAVAVTASSLAAAAAALHCGHQSIDSTASAAAAGAAMSQGSTLSRLMSLSSGQQQHAVKKQIADSTASVEAVAQLVREQKVELEAMEAQEQVLQRVEVMEAQEPMVQRVEDVEAQELMLQRVEAEMVASELVEQIIEMVGGDEDEPSSAVSTVASLTTTTKRQLDDEAEDNSPAQPRAAPEAVSSQVSQSSTRDSESAASSASGSMSCELPLEVRPELMVTSSMELSTVSEETTTPLEKRQTDDDEDQAQLETDSTAQLTIQVGQVGELAMAADQESEVCTLSSANTSAGGPQLTMNDCEDGDELEVESFGEQPLARRANEDSVESSSMGAISSMSSHFTARQLERVARKASLETLAGPIIQLARSSPIDCPYVGLTSSPIPVVQPPPPPVSCSSPDASPPAEVECSSSPSSSAAAIPVPVQMSMINKQQRLSHDDTMEAIEDDVEGEELELKLEQQERSQHWQQSPPSSGNGLIAPPIAFSSQPVVSCESPSELMFRRQSSFSTGPSPVMSESIKEEDEEENDEENDQDDEEDDESSISVSQQHGLVVTRQIVAGRRVDADPSTPTTTTSQIQMKRLKSASSGSSSSSPSHSSAHSASTTPVSSSTTTTPSKSVAKSESQREPLVDRDDDDSAQSTPLISPVVAPLKSQEPEVVKENPEVVKSKPEAVVSSLESGTEAILEHLSQHCTQASSLLLDEPELSPECSRPIESSVESRRALWRHESQSSSKSSSSQVKPVGESVEPEDQSPPTTSTMKRRRRAPDVESPPTSARQATGELMNQSTTDSQAQQQQQQQRRRPPLKQLKSQRKQQPTASCSMSLDVEGSICSSCSCMEVASFDQRPQQQQQQQPTEPSLNPSDKTMGATAAAAATTSSSAIVTHAKIGHNQQQQQQQTIHKTAQEMASSWMSQEEGTVFTENYWLSHWLYISEFEEAEIWRRAIDMSGGANSSSAAGGGGDTNLPAIGMPRNMTEMSSSQSERNFSSRYKSTTRKMIHRRASLEMYRRIMNNNLKKEKRVEISRSNGEFGFRIHGSRPVVVSAIERGTSAETCGLQVGDLIYAINGTNILDMAHSDVVRLAHSAESSALVLDLIPTNDFLRLGKYSRQQTSDSTITTTTTRRYEPTVTGFLMRLSPTTAQPLLVELQERMSASSGGSGGATGGNSSQQQRAIELNKVMRLAWRQRYFILRNDNCLYWYRSPQDTIEPYGGINLQGFSATLTDEFSEPNYVIRLVKYGGQPHYLGSNNMCDIQTWVDAINRAATEANQHDPYMKRTLILARKKPNQIMEPDCLGWLYKFSRKRGGGAHWRAAYFVLKDACLYVFRDQKAELVDQASAVYYLHGYRVRSKHIEHKKHTFELVPPNRKTIKPMFLMAGNEIDKKRWIAALEYSIDRWIEID